MQSVTEARYKETEASYAVRGIIERLLHLTASIKGRSFQSIDDLLKSERPADRSFDIGETSFYLLSNVSVKRKTQEQIAASGNAVVGPLFGEITATYSEMRTIYHLVLSDSSGQINAKTFPEAIDGGFFPSLPRRYYYTQTWGDIVNAREGAVINAVLQRGAGYHSGTYILWLLESATQKRDKPFENWVGRIYWLASQLRYRLK